MPVDLYLYDEKGVSIPSNALALRDGLGLKTLTSLDSACYYLENLDAAKHMYKNIMPQIEESDLQCLCQNFGLPPVAMERVVYNNVLVQLVQVLDLKRRVYQYLDQHQVKSLHYTGEQHWKWDVLFSICQQRSIILSHHQSALSRGKSVLIRLRDWMLRFKEKLMPADAVNRSSDFLFFMPIARLARGLAPIISTLQKGHVLQAIETSEQSVLNEVNVARLSSFVPVRSCCPKRRAVEHSLSCVQWVTDTEKVLEPVVQKLVIDTIQGAFSWVSCVYRILKACPNAVVVATFVGEPILEIARADKRKTAVIQTCGTVEYAVHISGRSTYLLASEKDRQRVLADNPQADIAVCGHPNYDFSERFAKTKLAEMRQHYAVKENEKLIVFAGSYAVPGLVEWESIAKRSKMFFHAVKDMVGLRIIIKLHPYEHRIEAYEAMLLEAGIKNITMMTQSANINHLLQISDAVVMLESTIGQESIVLDKPLLDIPVMDDWYGYHGCGAALAAYSSEEVREYILRMLNDAKTQQQLSLGRQHYLDDYFPMQDGQVVTRVSGHLKTLINEHK